MNAMSPSMADSDQSPWRRLRQWMQLDAHDLGVIVVYAAAIGLVGLATPLAVQSLVATVAFGNLLQPIVVLSLLVVLALLAAGVLRALQLMIVEILQRRLLVRLAADLAWRIPRVQPHVHSDLDLSKHVNRFFDILTVQKAASGLLLDGVMLALQMVVGAMVLALYSQSLLAFTVLLVAAIAGVVIGLGRHGVSTSIQESVAKHEVAGWLEELTRHKVVLSQGTARTHAVDKAESLARDYLDAREQHFHIVLRQSIAGYALQAVAAAGLLGVGGALVMQGELTLGQLVAAELIVTTMVGSLAKLGKQLELGYDLLAAIDKIGHLLDLPVERDDGHDIPAGPLSIRCLDVTTHSPTLSFANITLEAGARHAWLAASGGGKSTWVDAVLGLQDISTGRIEIGGHDVRQLSLSLMRNRIGVARDIEIMEGTIADNLRMGRALSVPDMMASLRVVGLEEVVMQHPDALERVLLPGGLSLSSGETARLMMARACVGQPGMIIIDGLLDAFPIAHSSRMLSSLSRHPATLIVLTQRDDVAALLPQRLPLTRGAS
jgi:putative ABC transport system ATP-binding protein